MSTNLSPAMIDAVSRALLMRDRAVHAGPVPKDVQAYWRAKRLKPSFSYLDTWREEHDHAFVAAKVMRLDVLEALQDELERAIVEGQPFDKWQKQIQPRLEQMGWWAPHEVKDPETGEAVTVEPPKRLKLIYDTNLRTAHAVGQYDRLVKAKVDRPYWLYGIGPSKRHREQHVAWHGLLLPVDDPFWEFAFPPNGYNCRCFVKGVSKVEYRTLIKRGLVSGIAEPVLTDEGLPTGHVKQTMVPVQLSAPKLPLIAWTNKRTGKTSYVPEGIQPGFDQIPGEGRAKVASEGRARIAAAQRKKR